jgi:hypothetical protein
MVVEFTSDLIQIFILNLSIGPPYYKGGCCRLMQVVKVLQFEMKYFIEKTFLPNSSGSDDPDLGRMIRPASQCPLPRPDDPVCLAVPLCPGLDDPALGRMIRPICLKPYVACRMIRPPGRMIRPWEFWRAFRA